MIKKINNWSDIYTDSSVKFSVHVEASTRCNSRCPACPRFIDSTPVTNPNLPLDELKYEDFVKWFPSSFLKKYAGRFNFCGNYGDPLMCVDIDKIIEYLVNNDVETIIIHTNGGIRSEKVWSKLGSLLNSQKRHVIFSVDGLEDTNNLYRREVSWKNIVKNIKTFNAAGGFSVQDFLVFKHNQHQIEEVKQFFEYLGVKSTNIKSPFGMFDEENKQYVKRPVFDSKGNFTHYLETADRFKVDGYSDFKETVEGYTEEDVIKNKQEWVKLALKDAKNYKAEIFYTNKEEAISRYSYVEDYDIECKALSEYSEVFLNPNGDIVPCCFLGQIINEHHPTDDIITRENFKPFSQMNLNNSSIESILGILDDKIASKWGCSHKEGRSVTCSKVCGVRKHNPYSEKNLYRTSRRLA